MAVLVPHAPEIDRTRANTWPVVNARIDRRAQMRLRAAADLASADELSSRIEALEHEWSFDRVLETEAALTGLLGLALAAAVDRRLLVVPGVAALMTLVHATHGWYPLLPLFRRMGIRTQNEIDRERYALKALRADFNGLRNAGPDTTERALAAWDAVCA
jgi:hypothetical protein